MTRQSIKLFFAFYILSFILGCGIQSTNLKTDTISRYYPDEIISYHPNLNIKIKYSISKNDGVDIPDYIINNMNKILDQKLSKYNLVASSNIEHYNTVEITVMLYKATNNTAKMLTGMLAGSDKIVTKIIVANQNNRKTIGESYFETEYWGYSGREDANSIVLIDIHTDKLSKYLTGSVE